MTTITHTTVPVAITAAQLKVMLAEAEAAEAAAAEAAEQTTDKYFTSGEFIEVPVAMTKQLLKAWHDAKAVHDKAKEALEAAKAAILDVMEAHECMVAEETGQLLVESRVSVSMVLDTGRLRKEMPEVAANYQRERRSRSFRVLV